MKALDTPALLALLEGRREATWILGEVAGGEVCTTEVNMFELEAAVLSDRRSERSRRLAALQRLRQRITVLPLDEKGASAAARVLSAGGSPAPSLSALVLGIAASHGAVEVLTTEAGRFPSGSSPVPVRLLRSKPLRSAQSRKS